MKSNELKIGNWLLPNHDLDGDYSQVSSLEVCYEGGKHYIVNGYKDGFFYNPIPLTPEILEKCKFGKVLFVERGTLLVYSRDGDDYLMTLTTIKEVKYLHTLQNLYFALTGEELPIEL